jgi:hypothetical protein
MLYNGKNSSFMKTITQSECAEIAIMAGTLAAIVSSTGNVHGGLMGLIIGAATWLCLELYCGVHIVHKKIFKKT